MFIYIFASTFSKNIFPSYMALLLCFVLKSEQHDKSAMDYKED